MINAFRSELIKMRQWPILASGAGMVVFSGLITFFLVNQITLGTTNHLLQPLMKTFSTPQGLIRLLSIDAGLIGTVLTLTVVTANMASEWSLGTLHNLLVCQPSRTHLLAGKMMAWMLFMVIASSMVLLVGTGVAFAGANAHGISTVSWTSVSGLQNLLNFFGNDLLMVIGLSLLGMFIAVIVKSGAAAVGIALGYALAGEGILGNVWPDLVKWFPVGVFRGLTGINQKLDYSTFLVVALAWMAAFAVVGALLFRYQDVTK